MVASDEKLGTLRTLALIARIHNDSLAPQESSLMQTVAASAPPRFRAAPGAASTVRSSAIGLRGPIIRSRSRGRASPSRWSIWNLQLITATRPVCSRQSCCRRSRGATSARTASGWVVSGQHSPSCSFSSRAHSSRGRRNHPACSDCGRRGNFHGRPALTHSLAVPRRHLARYICLDGPAGYALEDVARRRQKLGSSGRRRADHAGTCA